MMLVPIVLAAALLGGWLLFGTLLGEPRAPGLARLHLLLGVAAVGVTALLIGEGASGTTPAAAAALLATALASGTLPGLFARRWPAGIAAMVWSHAGVATIAIGAVLLWRMAA